MAYLFRKVLFLHMKLFMMQLKEVRKGWDAAKRGKEGMLLKLDYKKVFD
jgi:hypothetical protein